MANETLMFKKGLLQNLPSTKQAGTVYITTDERAMYVDISATERIRLGDFIEVTNESDLQNAKYQPYSTTALYYVSSNNKLLKYKGTTGSEASFVVINSTSNIETNLTNLTNRVAANENAITALQTSVGNLEDTVDANKTSIETALAEEVTRAKAAEQANASAITAEETRAKKAEQTNATAISGLQTSVTNLDNNKADKTALQAETEARIAGDNTLTTNLGKVSDRVTTLEGTVGDASSGLVKKVADLETKTAGHDNTITQMQQNHSNLASTVSNNQNRLTTLEGTVGDSTSGLVKDVADLQKALGDSNTDISGLVTRVTNVETKNSQQDTAISSLQNQVGTEPNASGEGATGLFLAVQNLQKKDTSIDTEISGLKSADSALDGRIQSLETNSATKTELSQVSNDLTNFQNTVANTYVTKTVYEGKVSELVQEDERLAGLIDGHDIRLDDLEAAVGDSSFGLIKDVADLKTTTSQQGTNITNLQNSLKNYVLTTKHNEDISALDAKIAENAADIVTNANNITLNKNNISTNAQNISTNTQTIQQHTIAISDIVAEIGVASAANEDSTIHQLIEELQAEDVALYNYIDNEFKTADAMKFMGSIADVNELLSKTDVQQGYTYVLTAKSGDYAIGDLFIAKADDVNSSLTDWVHVPSGYVAAHDPKLEYVDENTVKLKSGASGAHLGSITFVAAENTSTTVVVSEDNDIYNPTVTIGMSWGSF